MAWVFEARSKPQPFGKVMRTPSIVFTGYRAAKYPALPRLVEAALGADALGACLSGAGSAVLAFSNKLATISRIEAALLAAAADEDLAGRVLVVAPRNAGATVTSTS